MREHYAGLTFSAIVHFLVVAAFFILPIEKYGKPKNMLIDFSIEKGSGIDNTAGQGGRQTEGRGKGIVGRGRTSEQGHGEAEPLAEKSGVQTAKIIEAKNAAGHYSDPQGQVVVHGKIGTAGAGAGTQGGYSLEKGMPGGAGGGRGRTLDYGRGGQAEKSFAFIRENVMRNIAYPERARRMGWEGKVLLSFVVSESGAVEELKIINSSGFRALDENAKEAVLKTTFSQKIPYRLVVLLPVEYRLE